MTCPDRPRNALDRQRSPANPSAAKAIDWRDHLPVDWREQVIEALDFTEHHEYEMPASRCFGHDIDGRLCFYAHQFVVTENRSDNDEDFYTVIARSEIVRAWRLRDERWLIYRIGQNGDDATPGRGFYTFSDQAPR